QWYPYGNKVISLLDILYNSPRNRISNTQMSMVLWVLKEMNVPETPSLYEFMKIQDTIRRSNGVVTHQYKSAHGNNYYQNDVSTIIAQDYMNPLVCPEIRYYPEIPIGPVSEIWQSYWFRKDMDLDMLTPMYVAPNGIQHYYVGEFAQLRTNKLVLPIRWIVFQGELHAESFPQLLQSGLAQICDCNEDIILVQASALIKIFFDLQHSHAIPAFKGSVAATPLFHSTLTSVPEQYCGVLAKMPNPLRKLAQGDPLYSSFVDLFGDDVSGNRSKSWNKHNNLYVSHRNLPCRLLQQDFHIHFLSTSQHASVPEQIEGFKAQLDLTHVHPVRTRHATTGENIRFHLFLNAEPMDNPMQSEASGHIGGSSNCSCRKCKVGGSRREKMTNDSYDSLFHIRQFCSMSVSLREVILQVSQACTGVAARVEDRQKASGVKDGYTEPWIADLITRARTLKAQDQTRPQESIYSELMDWVTNKWDKIFNPNLRIRGFDPTQDTPIEILHTILLGIVKYVWYKSWSSWSAADKKQYAQRLQATDTCGLNIPPIRANYITQYANSLIGRQLKTIGQVSVFHIHDLVELKVLHVWRAVGLLMALLWMPEIDDMDQYTADVEVAVANVLDLFSILDPSKIIWKSKLHLLLHAPDDIRRFGPLVGLSTESYERFNQVFRQCSVFSNHLAPSHDIAHQLANQEGMKHRVTGGWWPEGNDNKDITWVRAGAGVRDLIRGNSSIQCILGWNDSQPEHPGSVRLEPIPKDSKTGSRILRAAQIWRLTHAAKTLNAASVAHDSLPWFGCTSLVATSGDKCEVGTWVVARSPLDPDDNLLGRIIEILAHEDCSKAYAVVDAFDLAADRHIVWEMPRLIRRFGEKQSLIVSCTDIQFSFNVQHDCPCAQCSTTGSRVITQERIDSGQTESHVEHCLLDEYVVNLHALHNAHLIRRAIPRSLTAPIPLFPTSQARRACHDELAAKLQAKQNVKDSRAASQKRKRVEEKAGDGQDAEMLAADEGVGSPEELRKVILRLPHSRSLN
ncbi:hypothetical protein BC835DRAFT_1289282, partial [Cytidiella melzeri]